MLQLPETDRELEKLLQVDVDENLSTRKVWRAGFNGSGVSQNNRLIERHESDLTNGAYWKSYDFGGNDGRKNLFAHPLGPKGENAFEHDGGEIIFNLPNGLQAYLLVDAKGQRIDKGPPAIVSDPVQKDRAVVNGLSCMSCHVAGMIRKQDEVREHVEQNRASFTAREVETVQAIYPPVTKFDEFLKEDAARFAEAMQKSGAPVAKQDPIVQLALRFEAELNAKLAAAELGLPVDEFLKALDRSPTLGRTLGSLKVPGRTIKREVFVSTFGDIVKDLGLGTFLQQFDSVTNTVGMELRLIPAGEFNMGSTDKEVDEAWHAPGAFTIVRRDAFANELPTHGVRITRSFYMSAYEVTQQQYQSVMGTNPSTFSAEGKYAKEVSGLDTRRFPVDDVTWFDAVGFCNKLSENEQRSPCYHLTRIEQQSGPIVKADVEFLPGNGYRLPTEAEWEYACRAGTSTQFHFGASLNSRQANFDGKYPYGDTTEGPNLKRTTTVGSYPKNTFGLYDMHGNVQEWCQDMFDEKAYVHRNGTTNDPLVTIGSVSRVIGLSRVKRGGSWSSSSSAYLRSADRGRSAPDATSGTGFRVVRKSIGLTKP